MSIYAIQQYHKELEKIIHFGGSKKETAIRNSFYNLLNEYARSKDLMLIPEISTKNKSGKIITPDGTIKDSIRNDWGYWESKDESDDIDEEIRKKFEKGYPSDNILFEDSQTAVLYQHGDEVMRRNMRDEEQLHEILTKFLSYERPEVSDFREAIEKFKEDIPKVTVAIREIIEAQELTNPDLQKAQESFLEMAKASINPEINKEDVKEMMIQHILSADIFNTIFDEPHFHEENNIAREINKVINTFFTGAIRRQTLGQIKHYYDTINARAASIADHHEKQKFLKVVYENFYKGYNPKAADRLGIVYTPNEIVQFMIRSTDYLLHRHFGKTMADKNVEILDPATGTGTFITDIIDYLPKAKLKYKYKNELHANEVAILPYYIANLNIEYTYKQKMDAYEEFENLCFVDTLDNTGFHWVGKQGDLFGVSAENAERIRRQNEKKISVIIGNPPYNAKQENYNYQNANRAYKQIDDRIKQTFIKQGTAQNQIVVYDMYTRFYRWAIDRLDENGIIAFITNRSFIDGRAFDGFRKLVASEFNHIYIIDLGGDVRMNPKLSGTKNNVFGIQTGVAIMFLVRKNNKFIAETKKEFRELKREFVLEEPVVEYKNKLFYSTENTRIYYVRRPEMATAKEKLEWLSEAEMELLDFDLISPDKHNNWINQNENDWDELIPIIDKEVKAKKSENAIFKLFSRGVETGRDEWVYDLSESNLSDKTKYLVNHYNNSIETGEVDLSIKWTSSLKDSFGAKRKALLEDDLFIDVIYRPFFKLKYYADKIFGHRLTQNHYEILGDKLKEENILINFLTSGANKDFHLLGTKQLVDLHFTGDTQSIPLYQFVKGNRIDNITDWALQLFQEHYQLNESASPVCYANSPEVREEFKIETAAPKPITKEAIFHYVYAVLHNPAYRKKYELNLKREFPRIPLYENFWRWAKWGSQLMNLHINYETVEPYPLQQKEIATNEHPKAKLKAIKEDGIIVLDDNTELHGVPSTAWEYKLGNRSALEWILDQYKEKKPKDPTIAEKFNTYKFADYKEQVIDLLKRVCTVSVETMKVVGEMEKS